MLSDKHNDPIDATDRIDRHSYEPAYVQLAAILRRQIASGLYRPGSQFLSERRLCAKYDVSPMTVRRVVNELIESGLLESHKGKGTFVKPLSLGQATFRLEGLQDQLVGREDGAVRLLEMRIVRSDEGVARMLRLKTGERVGYVRRLLLRDGLPVAYHREYLVYDPRRPILEAELMITSLEGLFRCDSGEVLRYGDLTIEAVALPAEDAELLQVPACSPAQRIEHIFFDLDSRPVSWGWLICRADRFKLATRIGPDARRSRANG